MSRLRVENLAVSYGEMEVLKNVTISVNRSEVLAIVGRSGCGKSTLLRAICALERSRRGTVWLDNQAIIEDGEPRFQEWEIRRQIALVPQGPSLLPHLTASQNISVVLRAILGLGKQEANERTLEIARDLGIVPVINSYPEHLSGGQLQRVQLARALVLKPKVLLLDEVTSALDPQTINDVAAALLRMRELERGLEQTILLVTHLLRFAYRFADRVAFLNEGVIEEEGAAATFADRASRIETKKFLDSFL